jgi:glycosyltransferase involved in cell wall biosynthesis
MDKKIIFWINDTDYIFKGDKPPYAIGGANVQMAFWSKCFSERGWKTYTLTRQKKHSSLVFFGIKYLYYPVIRYVGAAVNYLTTLYLIVKVRPDFIVSRAKVGELYFLSGLSKLLKFKLVHMLASDEDITLNQDKKKSIFQKAILKADYVIAQNEYQKESFGLNFRNSEIPIIPNIWDGLTNNNNTFSNRYDLIWVANFRELKRPLWFIQLAKELPEYKFAMVGVSLDDKLFEECQIQAEVLNNIEILGYKSLFEVTKLIASSRLLVCTSVFEGFPNTFLQAWSSGVPVVSTVDPSEVVANKELGTIAQDIESLKAAIIELLTNNVKYKHLQSNIFHYFTKNHSVDVNYQRLISFINRV